jgi:hypothetical protein
MATAAMNPSCTMSTTSMTKTMMSGGASTMHAETMDEAIQKMQSNLIRYARANDRRMVLRSLRDVKFLNCLLLDVAQPSDGPLFDLEKEVAEETVVFNDIPFKAVGLTADGRSRGSMAAGMKNSCIPMLKGLCGQLCNKQGVSASPREIYEKLVVRLAPTTASADPYFRLNSLLGSSDMLVMPLSKEAAAAAGPKSLTKPPMNDKDAASESRSIGLNLYEANGDIHMTLTQIYEFGLFRKNDVKPGRPWVVIHCVVNERANLSNNQSVRRLNVKLPGLY